MTLFKKVFQNQGEPAESAVESVEADLRKALTGQHDAPEPLDQDRFVEQRDEGQDAAYVLESELSDTDLLQPVSDQFSDTGVLTSDELEVTPSSQEMEYDAEQEKDSDASDTPVQSDEEIAACLDRALASPGFEAPAPDIEREPEMTEEILAEPAKVDEQCDDCASEATPDAPSALPSEEIGDPEVDVARFAREQISALNPTVENDHIQSASLDLSTLDPDTVPPSAPGRSGRRAGRVKTRLLGFNRTGDVAHDPFGQAPETTATAQQEKYPVGWLVIVEGPGVGHSFSLFTGASMIGRGEDQVIRLDFGDTAISRQNHAAIAYDEEQNKFYIGHGGKSNIIRRNARPVLSTEELHHADLIRIGETTLRFVALCGSDFQWNVAGGPHDSEV